MVNKHGYKRRHKGLEPYENHSHQRSVVSEQSCLFEQFVLVLVLVLVLDLIALVCRTRAKAKRFNRDSEPVGEKHFLEHEDEHEHEDD